MAGSERRRHTRVKMKRPVVVRGGDDILDGELVDISQSGAAVSVDGEEFEIEEDQDVEIDMADFGVLAGNIVRTLDEGFAMTFDLDENSEDRLISELTGYRSGIFSE
jgi:hypothetical protein